MREYGYGQGCPVLRGKDGVDYYRDENGKWWTRSDNVGAPVGIGSVLEGDYNKETEAAEQAKVVKIIKAIKNKKTIDEKLLKVA
ncbi:MAG: hypothetical protein Q7J54_06335 [Candidatus Woesearchaeota archaeon]|nr:hypothetical protein [Candidatus Woesearchaeota archaeon]